MKIIKFGGTSVKNAGAMEQAARIVGQEKLPLVVVLSATAGTTSSLLRMIDLAADGDEEGSTQLKNEVMQAHLATVAELGLDGNQELTAEIKRLLNKLDVFLKGLYYLREATNRVKDAVAATGELLSSRIFAAYLTELRYPARFFDVRDIMLTDKNFGSAAPIQQELARLSSEVLRPLLRKKQMIVTQGFIGKTREAQTTTLGRGGSDYTAALLGNVLDAEVIEIWTDVNGVMTSDPRVVPAAFTQPDLSFKEAAELAYFGAKVLHPSTILPAIEKNIPVWVKNTLRPDFPGTEILPESRRPAVVKAIAFRKNVTILTVESSRMLLAYGFLARIFEIFDRHRFSVDLISTSEISVSLTLDTSVDLTPVIEEISQFARVRSAPQRSIISVVGENVKESPGFLNRVFEALDGITIQMITFGASNVNLSVVVEDDSLLTAVTRLHKTFFEENPARGHAQN